MSVYSHNIASYSTVYSGKDYLFSEYKIEIGLFLLEMEQTIWIVAIFVGSDLKCFKSQKFP